MNKFLQKNVIILIPLFIFCVLFSFTAFGCHYCSPEGDDMRPINDQIKEIKELEMRIKDSEADYEKEKKINREKRDSIKFLNKEIDTIKILIN